MRERRHSLRTLLGGGILSLAILIAYAPTYNAGYVWDDDDYLTENPTIAAPDGILRIWLDPGANLQYYPLYYTTFWVEYRLWGLNPVGYHVVNVIIHVLNALLLWRILRRLGVPGAWWAAAVFALHPANVESVAWVTERRNVLSALFYLVAAWAFVRFRNLGADGVEAGSPRWGLYAVALVAFVAALLSKTVVLTLPAALLVIIWWKVGQVVRRDVQLVLPFLGAGLLLAGVTHYLEAHGLAARAVGEDMNWTALERVTIAGRAAWFYLATILWPVNLIHVYPRWIIAVNAVQLAAPIAVAATLVMLALLGRRTGRAPLAALLFFGGTLVPVLGFVNFGFMQFSLVADRFVYLPGIAIIALLIGLAGRFLDRRSAAMRTAAMVAGLALLTALGVGTYRQSRIYHSAEALWRDTLARDPDSWVARLGLASAHQDAGRPADAIPLLEAVVAARPDLPAPYSNLADALVRADRVADAAKVLREGRERFPDDVDLLFNLARVCERTGRESDAIQHYRRVIELGPRQVEAGQRLAGLLIKRADALQRSGLRGDAVGLLTEGLDLARRCNLMDVAMEIEARIGMLRSGRPQ